MNVIKMLHCIVRSLSLVKYSRIDYGLNRRPHMGGGATVKSYQKKLPTGSFLRFMPHFDAIGLLFVIAAFLTFCKVFRKFKVSATFGS